MLITSVLITAKAPLGVLDAKGGVGPHDLYSQASFSLVQYALGATESFVCWKLPRYVLQLNAPFKN